MRILVVEDDMVLANGLKVGLGFHGATLDVVSSCADGKAALAAETFDAVVLDVMLPDGSGLDLLASLRAKGDRIPVLLLTALDEVSDRIRGLDSGADDYLGKPFDLDELAARVRAISRRQEGRAVPSVSYNGVTLDLARLIAAVDGVDIGLSRRDLRYSLRSWSVLASSSPRMISRPSFTAGKRRSRATLSKSMYTSYAPKSGEPELRRCAASDIG